MMEPLVLSKKQDYFISLGKQGAHSFMMLGVILSDGSPKLLARVGKWILEPTLITPKILGQGVVAKLCDEPTTRKSGTVIPISYQAYAINYEQAEGFLGLIAEIDKELMNDKEIKARTIATTNRKDLSDEQIIIHEAVHSYAPTKIEGEKVTFEWSRLTTCKLQTTLSMQQKKELSDGAQRVQIHNTCRTTALNLVEAILGFATNISKYFFVSPSYQTVLKAGSPDKNTFYILPPPPSVYKESLSKIQNETLNKLYQRLEAIPTLHASSTKTRKKFDALKQIYNDIAGANQLSANQLLGKILEHESAKKDNLFKQREPNFFSKLFGIPTTTERFFKEIKTKLKNTIEPTNENNTSNTTLLTV